MHLLLPWNPSLAFKNLNADTQHSTELRNPPRRLQSGENYNSQQPWRKEKVQLPRRRSLLAISPAPPAPSKRRVAFPRAAPPQVSGLRPTVASVEAGIPGEGADLAALR